jgi:hypothetical protein
MSKLIGTEPTPTGCTAPAGATAAMTEAVTADAASTPMAARPARRLPFGFSGGGELLGVSGGADTDMGFLS